jgi:hypothetical protein
MAGEKFQETRTDLFGFQNSAPVRGKRIFWFNQVENSRNINVVEGYRKFDRLAFPSLNGAQDKVNPRPIVSVGLGCIRPV